MNHLTSTEEAQLLNEIKATNMDLGLLINFGSPNDLEWYRRIYTEKKAARKPIGQSQSHKISVD
jgi:hypothetical protein